MRKTGTSARKEQPGWKAQRVQWCYFDPDLMQQAGMPVSDQASKSLAPSCFFWGPALGPHPGISSVLQLLLTGMWLL